MTSTKKDPILVVIQLTGGNDYLNTLIPYGDPLYYDNRTNVGIPQAEVLPINDYVGLHPAASAIKDLYDDGKVAIINGVGYPTPNRSHFRSMDIWHTCEPDKVGNEGWLGRVIRDIDPKSENVLTGVNFGRGLPRALALSGVPVASVAVLETYGVLTGITGEPERSEALDVFSRMYAPTIGSGPVMDYLSETGLNALKGAEILSSVTRDYTSSVEYATDSFSKSMKGAAQVLQADIGTRICYTQHGSFDAHTNGIALQEGLLTDISSGIYDFYEEMKQANKSDDVIMFVFSEFGRRVKDNGNGTDHGSGGVAFVIGDAVEGGHYSEYPSLNPKDLVEGDLAFNLDFRSIYTEILEDWLEVDARPVVKGEYEKVGFFKG